MTPYEFTALVEHHNQQKKTEFTILRNTIYNAGANLLRGQDDEEIPLFGNDEYQIDEDERIEKLRAERDELFRK